MFKGKRKNQKNSQAVSPLNLLARGKGGKEEEISIDGGGAFSSSIYVHGIKVFLSLLWNFSAGVLFVHDCAQDSFYSKKMFDGPF